MSYASLSAHDITSIRLVRSAFLTKDGARNFDTIDIIIVDRGGNEITVKAFTDGVIPLVDDAPVSYFDHDGNKLPEQIAEAA